MGWLVTRPLRADLQCKSTNPDVDVSPEMGSTMVGVISRLPEQLLGLFSFSRNVLEWQILSSPTKVNTPYSFRNLATPEDRAVVRPNVDTLYTPLFDVSQIDLELLISEIDNRYWLWP
ncbi:hypothetical protein BDV09DRAFT_199846 [Aspergillus tetrazonus]